MRLALQRYRVAVPLRQRQIRAQNTGIQVRDIYGGIAVVLAVEVTRGGE